MHKVHTHNIFRIILIYKLFLYFILRMLEFTANTEYMFQSTLHNEVKYTCYFSLYVSACVHMLHRNDSYLQYLISCNIENSYFSSKISPEFLNIFEANTLHSVPVLLNRCVMTLSSNVFLHI